jgi:hypothetical protein
MIILPLQQGCTRYHATDCNIIEAPRRLQGSQPRIIHDTGRWNSEFKDHLKKEDIRPIVARVKETRTNGKSGRFSET